MPHRTISFAAAVVFIVQSVFAGDMPPAVMVPVAAYINAPDYEHDGSRVYAILKESGIQAIGAASAGVTVSVPSADAAHARSLLAEAMRKEHLRITLIPLESALSFLTDLAQLKDVSLQMSEVAFQHILNERRLEYRRSARDETVSYSVVIPGQHRDANVLFSFRGGLCCGIQRLQDGPAK